MITIRHRTASGDLGNMWEFCPDRAVIEAVIREGSAAPIAFTIKVCAPDRPRIMAHPIMRLDGESWRVLPAIFIPSFSVSRDRDRSQFVPRDCSLRHGIAGAIPCDLHRAIGPSTHLVLTNAPEGHDREMEAL